MLYVDEFDSIFITPEKLFNIWQCREIRSHVNLNNGYFILALNLLVSEVMKCFMNAENRDTIELILHLTM